MVEYSPFDWVGYFDAAFREVKREFSNIFSIRDEADVPPSILALRDAVNSLPCPTKILELRVDTEKHKHLEDQTCQVVSYDLSKLGEQSTEYCGTIDAGNTREFNAFLANKHGLAPSKKFANSFYQDLSTTYFSDTDNPDIHFQFLFYNIRSKLERYVKDLLELILVGPLHYQMVEKFKKEEIDYSALYALQKDPVLPMSKIIEKDPTFAAFVKLPGGEATGLTIEDLQEQVSDIQLIPHVPAAVKRVFRTAKELHVFGYFRYMFFTVSSHYAYLALESAIKNRYAISLGNNVILTNAKGRQYEMTSPSWERIREFCLRNRREGWSIGKVSINGEPFPSSVPKLLDWLVEKKIIPNWERARYAAGGSLRDSLSHLESASIFTPSGQTLRATAEMINRLYSSLHIQESKNRSPEPC